MSFKQLTTLNRMTQLSPRHFHRLFCTSVPAKETEKLDIQNVDEKPLFDDPKYTEEEIMKIRNKSNLKYYHRNILFNKLPYQEENEWFHYTVKYKKRMLGRYGLHAQNVPGGICWPNKEAVEDAQEYERVAYPFKIEEAWAMFEKKHKEEKIARLKRDQEIDKNMKKLEKWKSEMNQRKRVKVEAAAAAKEKRERILQEVRDHFGFKIDFKDERFKELLDQKEKEDKKKKKAAKKEEKMQKYMEKLQEMEETRKTMKTEKAAAKNEKLNEDKEES